MTASLSYPVRVLRDHLTQLEAAISVCLADPGLKPVHKLRTETRRIEALLLLLALTPGLPEHRKAAASLLRSLAKLRRAAGSVRDLDVHRKMLESLADTTEDLPANGNVAAGVEPDSKSSRATTKRKGKPAIKPGPAAVSPNGTGNAANNGTDLSKSAHLLRKHMGDQRDKAADALQKLLLKRQTKTARAAEDLLNTLQPAEDLTLPAQDLLRDAESVLTRDGLLQINQLASATKQDLHTIRKSAKAARYVAEAVDDDQAAAEAARGFEALQEAGGQWHDALELAQAARRYFGKDHQLTVAYREERNHKLEAYRAALAARARERGSSAPRKPAKKASPKRKAAAA